MVFIQVVEYETDRADDIQDVMQQAADELGDSGPGRLMVTQDRDNPNRFLVIVEFPSYEEAMANSDRQEVSQMAARLAELCTSGPRYHNLDVIQTTP